MKNYLDLLKLTLPSMLVEYFDLVKKTNKNEVIHLYFEEFNIVSKEKASSQLISLGFLEEITIQDFPLRGKIVYLHIKRRKWLDRTTKQIVQRNYNLAGKGTYMTKEYATFLKEIRRY
ncbi:ISAon1 family transposase N-terminal region protein [Flavivirga rizhaonensis]|uniref:Transposase n=1 Tax=Flavivirga rizhaonensis TaxID=2559571 RepID=A0A4S1DSB1_9FLAO|nr:transposase [Flavivirga rizhaonensis]TGV00623.1 transposase [Flavivirga rizhaonensis]